MNEIDRATLAAAVEHLHHCHASFLGDEKVSVTSGSVTIDRHVAVFELTGGNVSAPLAYAWIEPPRAEEKEVRHRVVLHASSVTSPNRAVSMFYLMTRAGDTPDSNTAADS